MLETERLILRRLTADDAVGLYRIYHERLLGSMNGTIFGVECRTFGALVQKMSDETCESQAVGLG